MFGRPLCLRQATLRMESARAKACYKMIVPFAEGSLALAVEMIFFQNAQERMILTGAPPRRDLWVPPLPSAKSPLTASKTFQ